MYASRYAAPGGFKPGSLGMALAINGAVIVALIYANPEIIRDRLKPPLTINLLPLDQPPDPVPTSKPQPRDSRPSPAPQPTAFDPIVPTLPIDIIRPSDPPVPTTFDGTGLTLDPPQPSALPMLIGPEVDSRFAGDFQPNYPPSEQRAGHAGRVVVRVLIGVDGRVKQVERVSATNDAFFQATLQRALAKWRFKPATRGIIPVEAWRTMSVSFVLHD